MILIVQIQYRNNDKGCGEIPPQGRELRSSRKLSKVVEILKEAS